MKSYTTGAILTASNTVNEYYGVTNTASNGLASTTEATASAVMPGSYTLTGIYVAGVAATGASPKQFEFIPQVNGGATTLDAILTGAAAATASDTAHTQAYVQGDTISLQSIPTSTPTNINLGYAFEWDGTGQPIFAQSPTLSTSATQYFAPGQGGTGSTGITTTEAAISVPWPFAGTISNLTVLLKTATGAAKTRAFTIMQGGGATTSTVSITNGTTGQDNTHTVSVAAGDLISIQSTATSTPAAAVAMVSFVFTPTVDGSSVYVLGASTNTASSTTTYNMPYAAMRSAFNTTEANSGLTNAVAVTATVYGVAVQTAAGGGGAWIGTIRQSTADTALTTTVTNPALSSIATGLSVSLAASTGSFTVKSSSTGAPAGNTGGWRHAVGIYIAPPAPPSTSGSTLLMMNIG